MNNVVISVENLSKKYKLGIINNGTFWKDIQTWIALKNGKEDPHSIIGESNFSNTTEDFWALKNIDFKIYEGDRIGIIGRNGAGKSTLLKLLSRITSPSEGTIKIKGKISSLLEVGTGFHGELTGRENIYLNGAILGMKKKQIDARLEEIIDFSGIEHHIDTPVKRYSSGMYVRLAFSVAAHLDSDILIADEVLAVGDASFQKKAISKLQNLSTDVGKTVLFVSHQMNVVSELCNKCIVLDKGGKIFEGTTSDSIDFYFGLTKTNAMEIKKLNNENNVISIVSFRLLDTEGNPSTTFSVNSPITAEITYVVNKDVSYSYIAFHVFDKRETFLIDTCDVDKHTTQYKKRVKGEYSSKVTIMPVLNAGIYSCEAWSGIPSEGSVFSVTERVELEIVDTGHESSKYNKTRACLLLPKVNWDTERVMM